MEAMIAFIDEYRSAYGVEPTFADAILDRLVHNA
jgi:hypothetical protein